MGKSYSDLGGSLNSADELVGNLSSYKANDVTSLTLLDDKSSMEPIEAKVEVMKTTLEEIISGLKTDATTMQTQANYVNNNSDGHLEW